MDVVVKQIMKSKVKINSSHNKSRHLARSRINDPFIFWGLRFWYNHTVFIVSQKLLMKKEYLNFYIYELGRI